MKVFITGGAGFIGCNSTNHFLQQGHEVVVFDNLSRVGTPANLAWLQANHSERLSFVQGDIRDYDQLTQAIGGADVVLHLAGQVAVTTSVLNPREDFEINALGTFNVLEAVRNHAPEAAMMYTSTNKVYGGMEAVGVVERNGRYTYTNHPYGISEDIPTRFPFPLRLLQRHRRPIRTRLRPHLRPAHPRLPPILHLRGTAVWRRRPGLGGPLRHRHPV